MGDNWRARRVILVTGHRRENFGGGMEAICRALRRLAANFPEVLFIYPVHLNPNVRGPVSKLLHGMGNIRLVDPQSYRIFVALMRAAYIILTDSGGVQEEALSLGKPVLVMRNTTERNEGLEAGAVKLVGADEENIVRGVSNLLRNKRSSEMPTVATNPYGDGLASRRIVEAVNSFFSR